jgi:tetratricopeptide (TPR) repeat protein
MLQRLSSPLNTPRGRAIVGLLVLTGIISVVISIAAAGRAWNVPVQTLLALIFVLGAALIAAPEGGRLRTLSIAAPAVGAVLLGITVLPDLQLLLLGLAVGWIIAGALIFRKQTPVELRQAVREMRKGNYDAAVESVNTLIKREGDDPEHYRLRAMIFRLDGRFDRAKRDYEKMLSLAEGNAGDAIRAEAYDGLAEVHVQAKRFEAAHDAALAAHELFPENWVPLYNLGLINDRLNRPQLVVDYLNTALKLGIPDDRQKLLTYLYIARAHTRLHDAQKATDAVEKMGNLWKGLEQLQKLISDEQAAPLSAVLADDVATARLLMIDELNAADL